MSRNKVDPPHPTPSPDGPHAQPTESETIPVAQGETAVPLSRDSGTDEIPLRFLEPNLEPDPFLESDPLEDPGAPSSEKSPPPPAPVAHDVDLDEPAAALFAIESPDPEGLPMGAIVLNSPAQPALANPSAAEPEVDPDQDVKIPWTNLILLAYSTGLTMLLTWLILTGRLGAARVAPATQESQPDEAPSREADARAPSAPAPPLPKENITELEQPIRLGDLEATPLAIEADVVTLTRSIEGDESRRAGSQSLILKIRFTNRSATVSFAPLERALVRDQDSRWDRSEITSGDQRFGMYTLAIDSEWSIEGQRFATLAPGESTETIVACEPGIGDRIGDESIWRLRVRTGLYRSDMLGVRFRRDQVVRRPLPPPGERSEAAE